MAIQWPIKKKNQDSGPKKENKLTNDNILVRAVSLLSAINIRGDGFTDPEHPLEEIKRASNADSYIKISLLKYSYLIYKAGYVLKSENDQALTYIKQRFKMMSLATEKPVDILFQEVSDDLVKYSNAFLIKARVDKIGFGIKAAGILDGKKPVGGYFRADPTHIRIKRNKHGTIQSYEQWTDSGEKKRFAPSEVVHFYMDKSADNAFGTPRISAALEDVKLLRRLEGSIISLVYRFATPLYQWKIGFPQPGMQATEPEIREAERTVENMPMDGIVFTNERTEIKVIGAEGNALDASSYLKYFERRVFAALGVSESQMGRGGAKQDADSMESQVHDTVKFIQRTMSIFIENMIISELLLEGGFNPILNEKDNVSYVFNEISLDTKVKLENHEILKYQQNVHTFEEMRAGLGIQHEEVDESRLYSNLITKKGIIDQQDNQAKNAILIATNNAALGKNITQKTGAKAGNNGISKAGPNNDVENRNRPENQHGKTSVKIKESTNTDTVDRTEEHRRKYPRIYKAYHSLKDDLIMNDDEESVGLLTNLAKETILTELKTILEVKSYDGIEKASKDLKKQIPNKSIDIDLLVDDAEATVNKIFSDIVKMSKESVENTGSKNIDSIFSTLEYRLRFLLEYIIPKTYWYSYVKTGEALGEKQAFVDFGKSEDKKNKKETIEIQDFTLDDIPAFHSYCGCKVYFKKRKGGEK